MVDAVVVDAGTKRIQEVVLFGEQRGIETIVDGVLCSSVWDVELGALKVQPILIPGELGFVDQNRPPSNVEKRGGGETSMSFHQRQDEQRIEDIVCARVVSHGAG